MNEKFNEVAISAKHFFGLFPKDEIGREAISQFINHQPFVPDNLLKESRDDVMTHNATEGLTSFPTERLRAWAISHLGARAAHVYTCDLNN